MRWRDWLLEGRLAPGRRLRRERDELARGLEAAETLRGSGGLDESRAAAIEEALRAAAPRVRSGGGRAPLAVAAALLVCLGAALVAAAWDPGLRLVTATEAPAPLEAEALALFDRLEQGGLALDLETDSPLRARRFVRSRTGLDARLVEGRPAGSEGRFEVRGVALTAVPGARAAGVAYRIRGRPALLLTARAGAVPGGPPHWTPLDREMRVFRSGSRRVLSWSNSGQSYVLVSELPGHGQASCGICHAGPERSRMVDRAAAALEL